MADDERVPATVEAALAQIQGSIDTGFADLRGQVALVLQRADQTDRRLDDHDHRMAAQDQRLREVETHGVTRDQIKQVVTHDELDTRFRRTTAVLSLVFTGVGILVAASVSVGIAALT